MRVLGVVVGVAALAAFNAIAVPLRLERQILVDPRSQPLLAAADNSTLPSAWGSGRGALGIPLTGNASAAVGLLPGDTTGVGLSMHSTSVLQAYEANGCRNGSRLQW